MAWNATKVEKGFTQGRIIVTVRYSNDANQETFDETYSTLSVVGIWPDDLIKERVSQLNVADVSGIGLGGSLKTQTPPVDPPPPTQAQLDQAQFVSNLNVLRQAKEFSDLISFGLASNDANLQATAAKVQNYKP